MRAKLAVSIRKEGASTDGATVGSRGERWDEVLKACLNGTRLPAEHVALPITPQQLAHEAAACRKVGAQAIHLHPRDAGGRETLGADAIAATLRVVRSISFGLPVGVSTGEWILPDPAERIRAIRGWSELPDFASVNFSESGAATVAKVLLERKVGVEAGLGTLEDLGWLLSSGLGPRCLRILIEPTQTLPAEAIATASEILQVSRRGLPGVPLLGHGIDGAFWEVLLWASGHGLDTRAGLEDTLLLPDGRLAGGNADLCEAAAALLHTH